MVTQISDWYDLDDIRNNPTEDHVLVNDLDSETAGYQGIGDDFDPIAPADGYDAVFDGSGYSIKDLIIDRTDDTDPVGLFSTTFTSAVIENLSIDGSITATSSDPEQDVGALVGKNTYGDIKNCVSHADVTTDGINYVGGLVGEHGYVTGGDNVIRSSYATGSVDSSDNYVGGLVGRNTANVEKCFTDNIVSGDIEIGGLIGRNNGGEVRNCYSTSEVNGTEESGGLVGLNRDSGTIEKSYAVGPVSDNANTPTGLCVNDAEVVDSYFDEVETGQTGGGGIGLTTSEMQGTDAETNMSGFDFSATWELVLKDENATADGYPILSAIGTEPQFDAQNVGVPFSPIVVDGNEYDAIVDGIQYDVTYQ